MVKPSFRLEIEKLLALWSDCDWSTAEVKAIAEARVPELAPKTAALEAMSSLSSSSGGRSKDRQRQIARGIGKGASVCDDAPFPGKSESSRGESRGRGIASGSPST